MFPLFPRSVLLRHIQANDVLNYFGGSGTYYQAGLERLGTTEYLIVVMFVMEKPDLVDRKVLHMHT
jgi:hypothetical protein